MSPIFQIILGSFLLGAVHVGAPKHWLPLVAISGVEQWNQSRALRMTAIAGISHAASTILFGASIGWARSHLYEHDIATVKIISPLVLVASGLLYCVIDWANQRSRSGARQQDAMTSRAPSFSLIVEEMFFSPCLAIVIYYFTVGVMGWRAIVTVSVIYFIVTVLGIWLLVDLGRRGMEKLRWQFLEHHEKAVAGVILILLGIMAYTVL